MRFTATAALLIALALPMQAAGSVNSIIRDCEDGSLSGDYSQKELDEALKEVPDDVREYTNCLDALKGGRRDSLHQDNRNRAASLGVDPNATVEPDSKTRKRLKEVAKNSDPVTVGGKSVTAGSASPLLHKNGFLLDVPWQVAILMGLISTAALGAGGYTLYSGGYLQKLGKILGRK